MRYVIAGAGISGLAMGQLLRDRGDQAVILEKESCPGGIAKTRPVSGGAYHLVGGHCLNSKYPEVLDFIFRFLPQNQFHLVKRVSRINFGAYEVDYPVEFSVPRIFQHEPDAALAIVRDFLNSDGGEGAANLGEWFCRSFGRTLAEKYFIPYNSKIWGRSAYEMDFRWVAGKMPQPDKKKFFSSLLSAQTDTMPHASFYYPESNNQQTFIDALASGLDIRYRTPVTSAAKRGDKWLINGELECDRFISTLPLNLLPGLIEGTPDAVLAAAEKLRYNKISNMLWKSGITEKTWTYLPGRETIFHRFIHIGSYCRPAVGYTITEAVGERSREEMIAAGRQFDFLLEPVDWHVSDHAYVVFDGDRTPALEVITAYLNRIGLYSVGRFGQWEYFNMDICIRECMKLLNRLEE